ncbi:hypothetical protein FIBSPDRAFT_358097 [Athelia psychrophila]|uniref:Uncharacterized protein n=1 Tax=Athelia psychrophila TaxID=1759441 RepID=A0A166PJC3_9AGAM|nr:hypothetical protein FIBSPDRAFT_358097 [Fibularhizoctonia sp. CBS 109695]
MPRRQPSGMAAAGCGRENDSRERRKNQHMPRNASTALDGLHAEIACRETTPALRVFASTLPRSHLKSGPRCPGCSHVSLPKPWSHGGD